MINSQKFHQSFIFFIEHYDGFSQNEKHHILSAFHKKNIQIIFNLSIYLLLWSFGAFFIDSTLITRGIAFSFLRGHPFLQFIPSFAFIIINASFKFAFIYHYMKSRMKIPISYIFIGVIPTIGSVFLTGILLRDHYLFLKALRLYLKQLRKKRFHYILSFFKKTLYTHKDMKKELIPANMPKDFYEIEDVAASVRGLVQTLQLDIMDGKYVPEKTWPYTSQSKTSFQQIINGDIGLPFWEELNYELDLMIERPELQIEEWLSFGASRVIFHYASIHNWEKVKNFDAVLRSFTQIGLAITIYDDLENIFPLIDEKIVDFVQVMGIAHIGYQGEAFDERSINIIKTLKQRYPELTLSVDGGVSAKSIPLLREVGVDRFVSGSGVFGGGLIEENIHFLNDLINE